jgi:RNA polymerase sigma-70 factor (ECF subfamily)
MCFRADLAQDISQEVFLQVWKRLPQLRQPEAFSSWLYKVTYSVGARLLSREIPRDKPAPPGHPTWSPGPEESLLSKEAIGVIRDELARLHPRYRVALSLYLEGLSYDEIGFVMGVPARTVETRLRRARRSLQRRLTAG